MAGAPVVAGGRTLHLDVRTRATAFDVAGKRLWTTLTPKKKTKATWAAAWPSSKTAFSSPRASLSLHALRPQKGGFLWRQSVGGPMRSAPTARGGRVFAITIDNKLVALNAATGKLCGRMSPPPRPRACSEVPARRRTANLLVAPFSSGEIAALHDDNGRILWLRTSSRPLTKRSCQHCGVREHAVIDRGRVFAISHGGIVVAIDLRNGQRLWDRDRRNRKSIGRRSYLLTANAEIVCLSREDGRIHLVPRSLRASQTKRKEDAIVRTGSHPCE